MKYKIGDKIKLILRSEHYELKIAKALEVLPEKIATIKGINKFNHQYLLEEIKWGWYEIEVEFVSKGVTPESIIDRFEILDL